MVIKKNWKENEQTKGCRLKKCSPRFISLVKSHYITILYHGNCRQYTMTSVFGSWVVSYLRSTLKQYFRNFFPLDDCRNVQFMQPVENMALNNHVIRRDQVSNEDFCQLNCYLEPNCVSYNYGPTGDGAFVCELSDRNHQGVFSSDLRAREGFTYTTITVSKVNVLFIQITSLEFPAECLPERPVH